VIARDRCVPVIDPLRPKKYAPPQRCPQYAFSRLSGVTISTSPRSPKCGGMAASSPGCSDLTAAALAENATLSNFSGVVADSARAAGP
jgi:hypothetical protein